MWRREEEVEESEVERWRKGIGVKSRREEREKRVCKRKRGRKMEAGGGVIGDETACLSVFLRPIE